MRWFKSLAAGVACTLLAACGGGGGGNSLYGSGGGGTPTGTATANSVEVLTSANTAGSGGDQVTITAVVKTASNVGLANAAVSFSTNNGTLTSAATTTDSTGTATAKFSAGSNKSNRTATITVTSGTATGSVQVAVTGSKLQVSGPTTLALGSPGSLTVKAVDSAGNPIAASTVAIASSLSNGLSATSGTTDANGQVAFTYTATNAGSDTITLTGVGATTTSSMTISGEDFAFTSPSASTNVNVGASQQLQVRYRSGGVGQAGRTVTFAATAGTLSAATAVTDASGIATVSIASTTAGSATVQASLSGGTAQASLPLLFVATTPATLVLQAAPTAIGPNSGGSTANQAQITARVTDASSNPVAGVSVNFSRDADPSGGNLQQASAVTDANGQATVQYIAGPQSTSSAGVVLRGRVASNTAVTGTATLTVNQSALFIALGTGNTINNLDAQTYKKDWTVYVTDANGVAVSSVLLTIKALPTRYAKGRLAYNGTAWVYDNTVVVCSNEDANYNGALDAGEDFNGDGRLQPGNVISVTPGTTTTDTTGRATISLIYAESYVPWVQIALTVQATVSGTESSTASTFYVDGLADDFTDEGVPPAGVTSPFGTSACNIAG